jgi:hypothetical protein
MGHLRFAKEHARIIAQLASSVGGPNLTIETLEAFLKECPQVVEGRVQYLVSGGFAVEIASREIRSHKDIDIVLLDAKSGDICWVSCRLDVVKPETYFAHMNLDPHVLLESMLHTTTRPEDHGVEVRSVHPALLLVQKSSDFCGKSPRREDFEDAKSLTRLLQRSSNQDKLIWNSLVSYGLVALSERVQPRARERLAPVLRYLQRFDGGAGSLEAGSY